jgi:insulysin
MSSTALVVRCVFVLLAYVYMPVAYATVVIEKGDVDQRKYDYLELPNKLKVILISDPEADKAAAALDVHVGSMDDPKDREGLAHFLEHMLFLGTKKYPNAADYQAYIDENAGGHNAYTSAENTNYFFDIDADKLEPALDRFAQFFIAPLFDANYVDRERNAVHSEYQAKIKSDSRRGYDVYRQLINPAHPNAKFSVGSLSTLADRPNDLVRDDLLAFYKQHYSADKMALVVLGKESIEALKAMVVERFAQIPLRKTVTNNDMIVPLFVDNVLPFEVLIQPVANIRQMSLTFPLPSVKPYYDEKPLSYLGHLLGHEGKGSILSVLKQRGWAEGLSAGGDDDGAGNATFAINVTLTEEGLQHKEEIKAFVFYAIDVIRKQGVEAWRYNEEQRLAKVAFQFREKGRAIDSVSKLASNLHEYPAEYVISADYLYKKFDANLIQRLLEKMTPDNLYLSTVYPGAVTNEAATKTDVTKVATKVATNKVTQHYQVPYAVMPLAPKTLDDMIAALPQSLKKQYHLPEKNIFVPEYSRLLTLDSQLSAPQKRLLNDGKFELWFKQDVDFGVPKSSVSLRVKSPLVSSSLQAFSLNQLLIAMINDKLNENSYPAFIAGLSYSLRPNSRGFDIDLDGYDNKMLVLLKMVSKQIQNPVLSQERFGNVKTELLRQLKNTEQKTPFRRLLKQVPVALYAPYFSDVAVAAALEKVSFEDLKQFSAQWLKGATMKGLFYGNIDQPMIDHWASLLDGLLLPDKAVVAPAKVLKLPLTDGNKVFSEISEQHITVDHNDKSVALYVQGVTDTMDDQAKMMLLRQVLESSFYSQLRTEQQLGYIVFLTNMSFLEVPGSLFIVQSPSASVEKIKSAIKVFVTQAIEQIPDDLSGYQRSLATKLLEKPQNLSSKAGRYWHNILKEDDQFAYQERLVTAINTVDAEQLRDYFRKTLLTDQQLMWFVADRESAATYTGPQTAQHYYEYP